MDKEIIYCGECGRPIINGACKKHGKDWSPFGKVRKPQRRGKYSGFSKNEEYGRNWK
jgi:hypothetical protein